MTNEEKIGILKGRLARLNNRGDKNIKMPGVRKKVVREIRNLRNNK